VVTPAEIDDLGTAASFLRLVSNRPDGDAIMRGLCHGPMSQYRAAAAAMHVVSQSRRDLVLDGHHGFTPLISKFGSVPVDWDFPVTRAFRTGQAEFFPVADLDDRFPLLSPINELLESSSADGARAPGETLVVLPIAYAGDLVAVCAIVVAHDGEWTWTDYTALDGIGSILGLWQRISHLEGLRLDAATGKRVRSIPDGGLTERQRLIVELIRDGKSNASIAQALGYSVGTVKAEVQRLLAMLAVDNRKEIVRKAQLTGLIPEA
jgi:DNA-binding CsgD family transcriptional regulator